MVGAEHVPTTSRIVDFHHGLLYAVRAICIGPEVGTLVMTVAAVTAIKAGNDHLGGPARSSPLAGLWPCHQ